MTSTHVLHSGAWRTEMRETLRLAWPMALTQLGQVTMMTTDLVLIGRLGEAPLAAASLGHTMYFALFVLGMGIATAVAPLAAQAFGAGQPHAMRSALCAGLQASVLFGIPCSVLLLFVEPVLVQLGQAREAATLATLYLHGMAWSLIPGWMFIALRGFMGALNRPQPALWIMLAAVPLNAFLAYGLIFGAFGMPRLGILGAGLATAIANLAMCAASMVVLVTQPPYRQYTPLAHVLTIERARMRDLLWIGLPISGAFLLEFGLFGSAALLIGTIGTSALAAHQIALQTTAALFMIPLGISMAATVRVGHAVGRGDAFAARRAGWTAIALAVIVMAILALVVVALRNVIPALFLGSSSVDAGAAAKLATQLLLFGAGFAVFDGAQTVIAGVLRGYSDTRVPLALAVLSYWAIGFVASWVLAFNFGFGAHGVWAGLSLGLAVFAFVLAARFHWLTSAATRSAQRAA